MSQILSCIIHLSNICNTIQFYQINFNTCKPEKILNLVYIIESNFKSTPNFFGIYKISVGELNKAYPQNGRLSNILKTLLSVTEAIDLDNEVL